MSILIIDKIQYEKEYSVINIPIHNSLYYNCLGYVNKIKLKKDFNIKGKIIYIFAKQRMNPTYCNIPNLKIEYIPIDNDDIIEYPNGDIIIIVSNRGKSIYQYIPN